MQTHDLLSPAIPRLSERQRAMLLEMGVPLWWPAHRAPLSSSVADRSAMETPQAREDVRTAQLAQTPLPPVVRPLITRSMPQDHPAPGLASLAALQATVQACTRCSLAQGRQCAVAGVGDPQPDWLIVGETPGEEEDRQGLPFVGRAGQLLDRMLAAMQLTRAQKVYIANVIKCRPPMNRNPDQAEIAECSPYLLRQVALLKPRLIVAMGRFAAQTLLSEGGAMPAEQALQLPLGKLRGRVYTVQLSGLSLPLVVTYHPAYLLRSPAEKAKAWADLCLAMDAMDGLCA